MDPTYEPTRRGAPHPPSAALIPFCDAAAPSRRRRVLPPSVMGPFVLSVLSQGVEPGARWARTRRVARNKGHAGGTASSPWSGGLERATPGRGGGFLPFWLALAPGAPPAVCNCKFAPLGAILQLRAGLAGLSYRGGTRARFSLSLSTLPTSIPPSTQRGETYAIKEYNR